MKHFLKALSAGLLLGVIALILCFPHAAHAATLTDYPIDYPNRDSICPPSCGSTHEIAFHGDDLWVTGQNYDRLVKFNAVSHSVEFYPMPDQSGPHGIQFDDDGNLWVALEFAAQVVRLDPNNPDYDTADVYDVSINCNNCESPIDTHPHGLSINPFDKTIWYTGKATGTLGRIVPTDGSYEVQAFPISNLSDRSAIVGSVPIYINPASNGDMWFTELVGNAVGRITPSGEATEITIPTRNSRPINILQGPDGSMWFSEEAGNNVARIPLDCFDSSCITEFPVPTSGRDNLILAAVAFDGDNNLWVQQYVDLSNPAPAGSDRIIKFDSRILTANAGDSIPTDIFDVPTPQTVMHRIDLAPSGNLWFTELHADKVGEVAL